MTPCAHIGIDLEGRWMKAAQVIRTSAGWQIAGACRVERDPTNELPSSDEVDELLAALIRAGCRGRKVVVAAPMRDATTAVLELPPRSALAPLEQIARLEMARAVRCAPEGLETSIWDVPSPPRGGDSSSVMAVAMPHTRAQRILDVFEGTGAEVVGIDLRACALGRGVPPCETGAQLAVDIGWDGLNIVLLLGGRVLYERQVQDVSLSSVHERLRQALGVERDVVDHILHTPPPRSIQQVVTKKVQHAAEAIAAELRRSIGFTRHRYAGITVERVVACGDGASLPGLTECLHRFADLQVTSASIATTLAEGLEATHAPALAAAIGLSMPYEVFSGSRRP